MTNTVEIINQIRHELDKLHRRLDKVSAACANDTAEPTIYTLPAAEITLRTGEHYAGLVLDATTGEPSHHLVLLAGEGEDMTWGDAAAWAKDRGGHLPTNQEQAQLFANLERVFDGVWYWAGDESCCSARSQDFSNGSQDIYDLDYRLRVRAVRRIPV